MNSYTDISPDSPEWYRKIIENISDVLYSFKPDTGTITFVTPNVSQFGYTPEEVTGSHISQFVHPDDIDSVTADMERTAATGETFPTAFRLKQKDGTYIYAEETGNPVYRDKALDHIFGTIRDISEQKKAEQALRESEQNYHSLVDNAAAVIARINRQGTFTLVNKRFQELTGLTEKEILGKGPEILAPFMKQPFFDKMVSAVMQAMDQEKTTHVELAFSDGSKHVWVAQIAYPWYTAQGTCGGLEIVSYDITERKTAEKELRESEGKWRTLTENSPDIISHIDSAGTILFINRAVPGLNTKDVMGTSIFEYIHPDDHELARNTIAGVFKSGEPASYKSRARGPGGTTAHYECRVAPVTKGKRVETANLIVTDITERLRAEKERDRLKERLAQSEKMEAMGRLAAGVVHDLSNLLSPIVGYPDLLLSSVPADSPEHNALLAMKESGEKAASVVDDLLTITRRRVVQKSIFSINTVIETFLKSPECWEILKNHPDAAIETDLDPDTGNIIGVPLHISKSIMNLIRNAAEAMPAGGIIQISTDTAALSEPVEGYDRIEPGEYVRLTVADTGKGIQENDLKSIFEPFYTRKLMGRSGTGLGLTIVWGTVEDHQGYIHVKSKRDRGTTFTLFFPVTRKKTGPGTGTDRIPIEISAENERIVAVDDKDEQLKIITMMLERLGYDVIPFSSGADAVEYMAGNTADLVILDAVMDPGMNGFETFEEIRRIRPEQKAVFISSYAEPEMIAEAERIGVSVYLKKPYTLEKIGTAVRKALVSTDTETSKKDTNETSG